MFRYSGPHHVLHSTAKLQCNFLSFLSFFSNISGCQKFYFWTWILVLVKNFKGTQKIWKLPQVLDTSFQELLAMRGKKLVSKYDRLQRQKTDKEEGREITIINTIIILAIINTFLTSINNVDSISMINITIINNRDQERGDEGSNGGELCVKNANLRQVKRTKW